MKKYQEQLIAHLGGDYTQSKDEMMKLFDDVNAGRYPYRFIYLCQDAKIPQDYIDEQIKDAHDWISKQPGYNEKRGW
jgi:hypothetical protein